MKNSYKPSKSFSNRAWNDMKARLDVEMPTNERNPRIWLLWSLGVLLLGFGIAHLSFDDTKKQTPIVPAAMIPVAANQSQEKTTVSDLEIARINSDSEVQISNSTQEAQTSKNVIYQTDIAIEKHAPRNTKYSSANSNNGETDVSIAQLKNEVTNETVINVIEAESAQVVEHQGVEIKEALASISVLPSKKIATLDFYPSFDKNSGKAKTYAAIVKPANKIENKTKLACGFGLTYGAINERGNTWSFGGEVDVIFKNRFSIGANLAYRHRQYRKSDGQFLYIQEDDLERATGLDQMTISSYELNYVSPELIAFQVDQIESIEFGVHPALRIVDKLWVEGRLSGIRARSVGTVEQDNVNTFQSDNVSSIVENAFTEWDILYGGGLRYQFNPHIGLNFRVQKVFQPGKLQNADLFDTQFASGSPNVGTSLPLISQPLFVEMGVSFRL